MSFLRSLCLVAKELASFNLFKVSSVIVENCDYGSILSVLIKLRKIVDHCHIIIHRSEN